MCLLMRGEGELETTNQEGSRAAVFEQETGAIVKHQDRCGL